MAVIEAHRWPAARMAAEGFAIILRRHQIEFRQPAHLDDELELATWVSGMQHATALRHYENRRPEDDVTGEAHAGGVGQPDDWPADAHPGAPHR